MTTPAADAQAMEAERAADAALIEGKRPTPHVVLIRIARPAKRNALTNGMVIEMARILIAARDDAQIRCVVITGDDVAFCAGADIKNMQKYGVTAVVNHSRRVDAWNAIQTFSKPMIAAVNGIAFGAGNELAMCCDFVVAGRNAQFGQPEVKTGGMAGDGGTQRLPRKVGPNLAAYMLMTGNPIDAETALRVGYAVELCEPAQTLERALAIAEIIASRAPFAVQATKACMHTAVGATVENGLAVERMYVIRNHGSPDRLEGMAAFVEKRAPRFTGVR
ncbi:MAG: enoyl-CoA hydratase-related protein [Betaproteobacteria bacterium]